MTQVTTHDMRLLAIGIASYPNAADLECLDSVAQDPHLLYDALKAATDTRFDEHGSVSMVDVSAGTVKLLLQSLTNQADEIRTLVIYFSGHGTDSDNTLRLHFTDSEGSEKTIGTIAVTELHDLIPEHITEILLILDCCHAGFAAPLSASSDPLLPSRWTILGATPLFATCQTGEGGTSPYTSALALTLRRKKELGERITALSLDEAVRRNKDIDEPPVLYLRGEMGDLVLAKPSAEGHRNTPFPKRFQAALLTASYQEREALWYALGHEDEGTIVNVFAGLLASQSTVGSPGIHEPLWIVRRAAGTTLAQIQHLQDLKKDLCLRLLRSPDWMDQCIGVIGCRYDLPEETALLTEVQLLLEVGSRMDVKWLAFLYLADTARKGLATLDGHRLRASGLLETAWGACEIWEHYCRDLKECEQADPEWLLDLCTVESQRIAFSTLAALEIRDAGEAIPAAIQDNANQEILKSTLLSSIALTTERGVYRGKGITKWLDSKLLGVWRGGVADQNWPLLQNLAPAQLKQVLGLSRFLPRVSSRMSIFQAAQLACIHFAEHSQTLSWGFKDLHLWVRRTAVMWLHHCSFQSTPDHLRDLQSALESPFPDQMPGLLDLTHRVLVLARHWDLPIEKQQRLVHSTASRFSFVEHEAMQRCLNNDLCRSDALVAPLHGQGCPM